MIPSYLSIYTVTNINCDFFLIRNIAFQFIYIIVYNKLKNNGLLRHISTKKKCTTFDP